MQQRLCFVVLMLGGALGCASNASISSGGMVAGVEAAEASLDGTAVGFPQYPSLSPDGSTVVFAWAGDLWSVGSEGGLASRLTAHPAEEGRSAFSPDGTRLAFESDRDGTQNLYVMPLVARNGSFVGGAISRVTVSDRSQSLSGFSPDGSSLVFSSRAEPSIYRHARMYGAPLDAGPVRRLTDAFGMSPSVRDGTVVFTRGYSNWERPKYRGSGAMDLYAMDRGGGFRRLTSFEGNDGDGHLLPDGTVVFVSSRDGQNNVWRLRAGSTDNQGGGLTQLTYFETGDLSTIGHGVRDFSVSADGSTGVFCVWDTIYTLDLTRSGAAPEALDVRATADSDELGTQRLELDNDVSRAVLSPDGKTVAVVARGEILVRAADEGRPTRRVTDGVWREDDVAWSPDGRWLYFTSDRDGTVSIYRASVEMALSDLRSEEGAEDEAEEGVKDEAEGDEPEEGEEEKESKGKEAKPDQVDYGARWAESLTFAIEPVVVTTHNDHSPLCSPDGRSLLFVRSRGDLMRKDLMSGEIHRVLEGWNEPEVLWASDSRHIVYEVADLDFNSDIWLLDLDDPQGEPVNLTQHPDLDRSPRLSADGKVLYFVSDRGGENFEFDVYRVYLDKEFEAMEGYELEAHFKDAASAAKKRKPIATPEGEAKEAVALEFDAEDAYLRIERITSYPGSESDLQVTPGGERVIFSGNVDGDRGLYSSDHNGRDVKSLQSGSVSSVSVSLQGDMVLFVRSGQATSVSPGGGRATSHPVRARVVIDVEAQQEQKFIEAARLIGEGFYHPTLKGLDWEAITARYLSLARKTRTSAEFNRVGNLLFGELEGSHLGMRGGGSFSAPSPAIGYLGIEHEPVEDGYRVTRVIAQGPADAADSRLEVGDVITAIDGTNLLGASGLADFTGAMAGTEDRETLLTVRRADPSMSGFVLITPIGYGAWNNIAYEDEVRVRAAEVDRLSGGRLGYLHIRGMNQASVRVFERDLYAAAKGKQGLIIDVRDNGGGSTTDILLSSLTAPRHAYTVPRGADEDEVPEDAYPRDRRLIYGYTRPISVICNQHSFSNAEIFSHAIKTIGRGTLVGETTFGGVISTGSARLIDGTTIRMPFRGWYLPDGTDMENNGAEPDVRVPQTPADEAAGRDPQLEAAVEELLSRTGG